MEGLLNPYRIAFCGLGPCADTILQRNIGLALATGFPVVGREAPNHKHLAVVGGGPSVKAQLERLAQWRGDIWAINQTASWLASQGIKSTLFTVDPIEVPACAEGVESALLASICSPELFESVRGRDVRIYHTEHHESASLKITGGPSSACRAPKLAIALGYERVTFFGCEGSFEEESHAYRNENTINERPRQLLVKAGGEVYRTAPDYLCISEYLANVISELPQQFEEESGGLLRALILNPSTWSIVAMSESLKNELDPTAKPYLFQEAGALALA